MTATPEGYQSESWTDQTVTVKAEGSTDNFTAAADLIYQVSTDGVNFTNGAMIELPDDGSYLVYFRTVDQSGNISAVATYLVNKDSVNPTIPEITMVSDGANYQAGTWAMDPVEVIIGGSIDVTSGIAKYQYQINDGAWIDGTTLSFDASGEYTISCRSIDQAGNLSPVATESIKVDLQAPTAPIITTSPDYVTGTWTNQAITVTATGSTDDLTPANELSYQYSLDGSNYQPGNLVELDSDGIHNVYFKVIDGSNRATVVSKSIKIDQTVSSMPEITMTSGGNDYLSGSWATDSIAITIGQSTDATSGIAKYQYLIDEGAWNDGTNYVFDASGEYNIYYRSIDQAGNNSVIGSKSIKVDLEAPMAPEIITTSDYFGGSWARENITVTAINATDNMTKASKLVYEYSLDGINYQAGNTVELASDGIHTVYFKVTDASGKTAIVNKTVKVDQTSPTTPLITIHSDGKDYQAGTWATANVTVTLSESTDQTSGINKYQYRIDKGEWTDGSIYTFTKSGEYTFQARSIDKAGNNSAIESTTTKVDLEAPEAFEITADSPAIGTIEVQSTTIDMMSKMAVNGYRVFDGYEWSAWQETVEQTLTGYQRGEVVTIKVEAKDQAGNIQSASLEVETLLNVAPEAFDDSYTLTEDDQATILDVLANDVDVDQETVLGDTLEVVAITYISNPKAGMLNLEDGVVSFTPAKDFNGTVSFEYTFADELGTYFSASVALIVTASNDQPVVVDDKVTTKEEKAVTINVLDNDVDIDS